MKASRWKANHTQIPGIAFFSIKVHLYGMDVAAGVTEPRSRCCTVALQRLYSDVFRAVHSAVSLSGVKNQYASDLTSAKRCVGETVGTLRPPTSPHEHELTPKATRQSLWAAGEVFVYDLARIADVTSLQQCII